MPHLYLTSDEVCSIQTLLDEIAGRFPSIEDPGFLRAASLYAHELPRRVRQGLHEFRLLEPREGKLVVSGYPVEDRIGDTPKHWRDRNGKSPALREEVLLVLFGSLLGDVIGWATQQNGYLVHDVLPIQGHENEQLGSGSEQLLWWHTEDAFHSFRGDYLGLLCLRNPDGVETTFASLENLTLSPRHLDLLFEPHFTIRPDESHLPKNQAVPAPDHSLDGSYEKIEKINTAPERVAVLFGDRKHPYLRLDPYFMDPPAAAEAREALDALIQAIDGRLEAVVLAPGDFLFVDNFQAVHGRKPFHAHYNGRDRWLKRVNIARDLRKSRESRRTSEDRILF
jgi:Fe(II)/alpha-ketoglutarate-dependent arginine beta-hydroxylase